MGLLIRALEDPARPFNLRIANRLFGENTFAFEHSFLEWTKAAYGAALEPMNFKGAAEASRSHINAWIENRTEHRIQNLLPASSINADTRLVLVNAIYFHAVGKNSFPRMKQPRRHFISRHPAIMTSGPCTTRANFVPRKPRE